MRTLSTFIMAAVISTPTLATAERPEGKFVNISEQFDRFDCEIINVYNLSGLGTLQSSSSGRGDRFSVSRRTGEIKGDWVATMNAQKTDVLSDGGSGNSFRAVTYFNVGAGHLVQTIDIQVFKPWQRKPFVSFSMGGAGILTGLCEVVR